MAERNIAGFASSSNTFFPFKSVPPSHTTSTEQNEERTSRLEIFVIKCNLKVFWNRNNTLGITTAVSSI